MSELSDSCDGSHKYLNTESFPDIVLTLYDFKNDTEYNELIKTELDLIPLSYREEGQNIFVNKKTLTYNQLMKIIDDIEGFKNKTLTKCSKAKLEPILRAKNALENDFIDQVISRETSNKCQELYESTEKEILKITEKKIKFVLGSENYERYLKEMV